MKNLLYAALILFISCSDPVPGADSTKADTVTGDTNQMHIQIPASTCYRYATASDTINLKVEKFPNVVTGMLSYRLKEKDKNTGEIEGVLKGDTLIAEYSFMSEGTRSLRPVIFLLQNNTAVEGYGKMRDDGNGKMIFDDITKIDFSKGTALTVVPCDY